MNFLIFVVILFVHAVSSAPECPADKVFRECGSACPPTCKEPNPQMCTMQCVADCFCKDGFVQNHKGECITLKQCNGTEECLPSQQFKECGTACPPTCKNPGLQPCTKQCVPGCFCKAGLFKNDNGECVDLKDCPSASLIRVAPAPVSHLTPKCPPNQQFEECGTACPPTCKDPNPQICTKQCVAGCFCKGGLVKNEESGECVDLKDCPAATPAPPQCPANQEFVECGSACAPTCKTPKPEFCTLQCIRGCFCKADLVKNDQGDCVDLKDCSVQTTPQSPTPPPHACGKNEVWSDDKCVPPAACQTPRCPNNKLNSLCDAVCRGGGCVCKSGFYRDDHSKCVQLDKCNVSIYRRQ